MAPSLQNTPAPFVPADMRMSHSTSAFFPASFFLGTNKRNHPAAFSDSFPQTAESLSVPSSPSSFSVSAGEFPGGSAEPKRRRLSSQTPGEVASQRMCSVSSNDDCVLASLPSSFAPERRAGAPACVSSSPLPSSFPPFSASAFSQCRSLEFSRGCAGAPSLLSHLSSGSVAAASSAPSLQAAHAGGSRYPTRLLRDREWEVGETAQRDKEDGAAPTLLPRRPRGPGGGKAAAEMLRGYDLYM